MATRRLYRVWAYIALLILTLTTSSSAAPSPHGRRSLEVGNDQRIAGRLNGFCAKFRASCRRVCVKERQGRVKVEQGCTQNVDSGLFEFSCRCHSQLFTNEALAGVSGPQPSTVTVVGTTQTFTETLSPVVSTQTLTAGSSTEKSTQVETVTLSPSVTTLSTTSTSRTTSTSFYDGVTTVRSYTHVTPVTTIRQTDEIYTTVSTRTKSITFYKPSTTKGPATPTTAVPVLRVASPKSGKGSVDAGSFCDAYTAACDRTCAKVDSVRAKLTCKSVNGDTSSNYYHLYCSCANHKLETKNALADLDDDGAVNTISVTIVSTSTALETKPVVQTTQVPYTTETYLETLSVTLTNPASSTVYTTVETTKTRTVTRATGTISKTRTQTRRPTYTTMTVSTATISLTQTLTTTVEVLLAPTGKVRLELDENYGAPCIDNYSPEFCTPLGWMHSTKEGTRVGLGKSKKGAMDVMLVSPPGTHHEGYYALVDVESGNAIVPQGRKYDIVNAGYENCVRSELVTTRTLEEAKADKGFLYWASVVSISQLDPGYGVEVQLYPSALRHQPFHYPEEEGTEYDLAALLSEANTTDGQAVPDKQSVISLSTSYEGKCRKVIKNEAVYGLGLAFVFADLPPET